MSREETEDYCECGRRWLVHHHPDGLFDLAGKAVVDVVGMIPLPGDLDGSPMHSVPGTARCARRLCRWLGRTS